MIKFLEYLLCSNLEGNFCYATEVQLIMHHGIFMSHEPRSKKKKKKKEKKKKTGTVVFFEKQDTMKKKYIIITVCCNSNLVFQLHGYFGVLPVLKLFPSICQLSCLDRRVETGS